MLIIIHSSFIHTDTQVGLGLNCSYSHTFTTQHYRKYKK